MFFVAYTQNIMLDRSKSTWHNDGVTYGIDWDTGLCWFRVKGTGVPIYGNSFQAWFK